MEPRIELLRAEAARAIDAACDFKSLDAARVHFIGRTGEITRLSEGMREIARRIVPASASC